MSTTPLLPTEQQTPAPAAVVGGTDAPNPNNTQPSILSERSTDSSTDAATANQIDRDGGDNSQEEERASEEEQCCKPPRPPSLFQRLGQWMFWTLVNFVAEFSAAVASHPAVQDSAAQIIVKGMNAFMTQPDLDETLRVANETLAKSQEELALSAGHDAPKLVSKFFEGWRQENKNQKEEKQRQKQNAKAKQAEAAKRG